jgi:hypothetical protein
LDEGLLAETGAFFFSSTFGFSAGWLLKRSSSPSLNKLGFWLEDVAFFADIVGSWV